MKPTKAQMLAGQISATKKLLAEANRDIQYLQMVVAELLKFNLDKIQEKATDKEYQICIQLIEDIALTEDGLVRTIPVVTSGYNQVVDDPYTNASESESLAAEVTVKVEEC